MSNGLQLFRHSTVGTPGLKSARLQPWLSRWQSGRLPTVPEIADHEYLLAVFDHMRQHGGPAAGLDGISYGDLSRTEAAQIARTIGQSIRQETYAPYPTRTVHIPKPNGKRRKLSLPTIMDRVVGGALALALTPWMEAHFHPYSMGFRPGRGTWTLFARLEQAMVKHGCTVLTVDDVKDAFPSVSIDLALDCHRRHIQDPCMLRLIERTMRGASLKALGLDQGNPYSPLALNVCFTFAHDFVLERSPSPVAAWFRYADNLVYLTQTLAEGHQVLAHVNGRLSQSGFCLKGEPGQPVDLQHEPVELLGLKLFSAGNKLKFAPGESAFDQLARNLVEAHTSNQPVKTAQWTVNGWLEALGPTFETERIDDTLNRVMETCVRLGFREMGNHRDLKGRARESWRRWQTYREKVQATELDSNVRLEVHKDIKSEESGEQWQINHEKVQATDLDSNDRLEAQGNENSTDIKSDTGESWWRDHREMVQSTTEDLVGYPVRREGVAAPPATTAAGGL